MNTEKLYYKDPYRRQFDATVLSCQPVKKGYAVVTDVTAFYPEGGGQPCDLGTLGNARVLDVQETEQGITHLCDSPLPLGACVHGVIDWQRRFDLMQQHTGEHMVSGVIHAMFGCHNVGFHLGNDTIEIDFDKPIPAEALAQIEERVNRAIWENGEVLCHTPDPDALEHTFYRTKKALPWPVRIVKISDVDSCACCGLHTARTGEVGLVKLLSCIKFHEGVRIEMVCGGRAMGWFSAVYDQNRQISRLLSAKPLETAKAAQRLEAQLSEEKQRAAALEKQLLDAIAEGYRGKETAVHFTSDPAAVRPLADRLAALCPGIVAVCGGEEGNYRICLARPGGDVSALGKALHATLGGKGGGRDGFHQGTAPTTREKLSEFFCQNGIL